MVAVGARDWDAARVERVRAALDQELRAFVGDDVGRSVAVRLLGRPEVTAAVGADVVRPAASVLKLLPALALYEAARRGELDLDATVRRGDLGVTAYPSVLAAFAADRPLALREVCALSLITSDNPAAEYLRRLVGPARVERVAGGLGLAATALRVGFGDVDLGAAGRRNVTTAAEALRLVAHVDAAPGLGELRRFLVNNQRNTRIPLRLDDGIPVAHKTGSLAGVVNDVGVVRHPCGARVALAYLCDRQPDPVATATGIGDSAARVVGVLVAAVTA